MSSELETLKIEHEKLKSAYETAQNRRFELLESANKWAAVATAEREKTALQSQIIEDLMGALTYLQTIGCNETDCLYKSGLANEARASAQAKLKLIRGEAE